MYPLKRVQRTSKMLQFRRKTLLCNQKIALQVINTKQKVIKNPYKTKCIIFFTYLSQTTDEILKFSKVIF